MTSAPRILGIDIGTSLGWAYASKGKIQAWGVEDFRVRGSEQHADGLRLQKFWNWLADWAAVDRVYYERIHHQYHNGDAAAATYFGMLGVLRMFCAGNNIPLIPMHTSTVQYAFVGERENRSGINSSGERNYRVTKADMCAQAHRMGWRGGEPGTDMDHDACDACAIIVCAERERGNYIEFF